MNLQLKNIVYFALLTTFISYKAGAQSIAIEQQLDSIYKAYDTSRLPGIALSIIKNGDVIFHKGYGSANLEYEIPITINTVFNLASVTKQFTVFALLLLEEEEGKLSLEDDIRKYIPELHDFETIITLRHLANNTSGIRDDLKLLGMKGFTADNVITQKIIDEITLQQKELNFIPGSQFGYSNAGFNLLANVIAKVTGTSYAAYINNRIFKPLKMNNSYVLDDFHKVIKNKAYSYEMEETEFQYAPANYSYSGASGIYTTLLDFEKWALNFRNLTIGNKNVLKKMSTLNMLNDGKMSQYALGQFVDAYQGVKRIWHSGGDAGYRSYLGRFPEQDISVLLLSNNASVYAEGEALKAADIFLKPYFINKLPNTTKIKFQKLNLKKAEKFSGNYLHQKNYYPRSIYSRNDSLIYSRPDQGGRESVLKLKNENKFQLGNWNDTEVQFFVNKNIQTMNIIIDGKIVDTFDKYIPTDYTNKELAQFEGDFFSEELQTNYTLECINNVLTLKHAKMKNISLKPLKEDGFLSNRWQFRFLEFVRDKHNIIIGIKVSTDRAEKVHFIKNNVIKRL
jgi:CubicO group peptidase (beta-lactamase class C family)